MSASAQDISKSLPSSKQEYIPITERFLSTEDAAKVLNTSPTVLRESRSSGKLFGRKSPSYRKVGDRKIVYEAQTLIDWVESAPLQSVVGAS